MNLCRGLTIGPFPTRNYQLEANNHTFVGILAFSTGAQSNLTSAGEAERIEASRVTGNFLAVLGIQPALGRTFLPEEDKPGGPLAVILSDSLWRRKFSADPAIVGKSIELDGEPTPSSASCRASFRFPDKTLVPEFCTPAQFPPQSTGPRNASVLTRIIGRLATGVSLNQAHADLATLAAQSNRKFRRHSFTCAED